MKTLLTFRAATNDGEFKILLAHNATAATAVLTTRLDEGDNPDRWQIEQIGVLDGELVEVTA